VTGSLQISVTSWRVWYYTDKETFPFICALHHILITIPQLSSCSLPSCHAVVSVNILWRDVNVPFFLSFSNFSPSFFHSRLPDPDTKNSGSPQTLWAYYNAIRLRFNYDEKRCHDNFFRRVERDVVANKKVVGGTYMYNSDIIVYETVIRMAFTLPDQHRVASFSLPTLV